MARACVAYAAMPMAASEPLAGEGLGRALPTEGLWRDESSLRFVDRAVGKGAQFVVGAVLDRVRHEDVRGARAERARLGRGGGHELGRCQEHAGQAQALEVDDVVHTARRA